ncbi:MAG: M28 family peptidase [Spartobacteria bacterium]|nr:M28 family peptidase [Spartobacteria bacterium]
MFIKRIDVCMGAALAGIIGCCGCSKPTPDSGASEPPAAFDVSQLNGPAALQQVHDLLDLGLRDSGTEGLRRAADFITQRLEEAGVEAEQQAFTDLTPRGEIEFINVIGKLPGRGEGIIMLGSHYDTKIGMPEGFEGANDSGSSSGLLIELARVMAAGPVVGPEIWFVFFDGEECWKRYSKLDGLHGSRYLAGQLIDDGRADEVEAVIILDMIGDKNLNVTIPRNVTPELVKRVFEVSGELGYRSLFSLFSMEVGDDHMPFLEAGIPAVNLIDFEYGSSPGRNDYWHTVQDTRDKISAESLEVVGKVALGTVNSLLCDPLGFSGQGAVDSRR